MSSSDLINFTIITVMTLGFFAFLLSEKARVSSIPLLIILGFLFGPVFGFIPNSQAHTIFNYARVFGLVLILFAEGHSLKWPLMRKHIASIGLLDTVGLLITAVIGGLFFAYLFQLPFAAGFLFGAIISSTDPATLIPLFKQNKVDENIETVIVTESIFNDPLGIVLTILAISLVAPQAPEARFVEEIAHYTSLYPAALIFFIYEIVSSVLIGFSLGALGYWIVGSLTPGVFPQIFSLAIAFGGFLIGEAAQTSGYLVATTIGIVFGNFELIFKKSSRTKKFEDFVKVELGFNETLASLASVFIFILIGATTRLSVFSEKVWLGVLLAFAIMFVARPVASLIILPLNKWNFREYLFIALEGPRGVVPSALAAVPLSLGQVYHNQTLISWGEVILTATIVTVLVSVLAETLWVRPLTKVLLKNNPKKKLRNN